MNSNTVVVAENQASVCYLKQSSVCYLVNGDNNQVRPTVSLKLENLLKAFDAA
jgi:hypothetical protein